MTPRTFVKAAVKTIVDGGVESYKGIFADPGEVTDPYWKRVLDLYRSLPPRRRKVILEIMRQVQVDTVSEVFGILDGTSPLNGRIEKFDVTHAAGRKSVRLNGDLQDLFLSEVESK